ncbi:MAG: divalent-cation tolerance protein CutA [Candidatus Altiarchaeota archaeon]
MKKYVLIETTAGSKKEAEKIAISLVEKKLVACVNYFPATSVYRWKGKVEKEEEYLLLAKTTDEKFEEAEREIKRLHSYECPAIIAIPIQEGSKDYLAWIVESL